MPRVAPERQDDVWAHDHRERKRVRQLCEKGPSVPGDDWLSADARVRSMRRHAAIVRELSRLLSVLTNYRFFDEPIDFDSEFRF